MQVWQTSSWFVLGRSYVGTHVLYIQKIHRCIFLPITCIFLLNSRIVKTPPRSSIFSQERKIWIWCGETFKFKWKLCLCKFWFKIVFTAKCWKLAPCVSKCFAATRVFRNAGQVFCQAPSTTSRPDVFDNVSFLAFALTNNRVRYRVPQESTPKGWHWLNWSRLRSHCRRAIVCAWLPVAAGTLHNLPTTKWFDHFEHITIVILDRLCQCSLRCLKACKWQGRVHADVSHPGRQAWKHRVWASQNLRRRLGESIFTLLTPLWQVVSRKTSHSIQHMSSTLTVTAGQLACQSTIQHPSAKVPRHQPMSQPLPTLLQRLVEREWGSQALRRSCYL